MNFEEPHIKIGLLDLKQSLNLHGRDSRVVRWAMKWSPPCREFPLSASGIWQAAA